VLDVDLDRHAPECSDGRAAGDPADVLRSFDERVTSPPGRLHRPARAADAADVLPLEMAISFTLIGLGAVVAAGVGLRLPRGERATALLALAVGGGVGLIALAIGSSLASDDDASEAAFLVASVLGFVATAATAAFILTAARREGRSSVSDRAAS
jgi:hypothetical protein